MSSSNPAPANQFARVLELNEEVKLVPISELGPQLQGGAAHLTRPLITTRISGAVLSKRGREIAQSLIYDEEYQRRLRIRLMNGSLHPTMEKFLWNLAGHVVVEKLEIDDKREEATRRAELSEMSADQLAERAQNLFLALEKVRAAQADIVDVQPTETPTTDAIDDASGEVQQLPRE